MTKFPARRNPDGCLRRIFLLIYPVGTKGGAMELTKHEVVASEGVTVAVFKLNCRFTNDIDVALNNALAAEIRKGIKNLILDLTGCALIDSAGMHVLVSTFKRVTIERSRLVLANPNNRVAKSLEITKLDSIIRTYPTVEAAIASFTPQT